MFSTTLEVLELRLVSRGFAGSGVAGGGGCAGRR